MKRLVLFWSLCSMSKDVAGKPFDSKKSYKQTHHRTDFPEAMPPEMAIEALNQKHGYRPEKPMHIEHKFAHIRSWGIADVAENRPHQAEEQFIQPELFTNETYGQKQTQHTAQPE